MIRQYREFLMKHGVVALATAVVIGGAVGKLVTAVVSDLIMPIVGSLTPNGNWRTATLNIGAIRFGIGDFAGALLDFVIVSVVVFLIVKAFLREQPSEPATESKAKS